MHPTTIAARGHGQLPFSVDSRTGQFAPGIYFVGLLFQYGFTSMLIGGAGRDAEHVVERLVGRTHAASPAPTAGAPLVQP